MNISTGGPHILFFERDQQLATLLTSEFQLAGYECHTARTAVEVFDAIARYQARILLVNLAQAAAGRREFWVALDTQRRGRGVQVFTYQCKNIGSYGSSISNEDLDERTHLLKPDIEVDGMLGVMNLVEAIKRATRPAGNSTSSTGNNGGGTLPRIAATPVGETKAQQPQYQPQTAAALMPTAPLPPAHAPAPATATPSGISQQATMRISSASIAQAAQATQTAQAAPAANAGEMRNPVAAPSVSEKIRAVIYPNQRSWNKEAQDIQSVENRQAQNTSTATHLPAPQPVSERRDAFAPTTSAPTTGSSASGTWQGNRNDTSEGERSEQSTNLSEKGQPTMAESGLAQLSRMLEEQRATQDNSASYVPLPTTPTPPAPQAPMSSLSLRAAPIQDIPTERDSYTYTTSSSMRNGVAENRLYTQSQRTENAGRAAFPPVPPATPLSVLASISETPVVVSPSLTNDHEQAVPEIEREVRSNNGNGRQSEHSTSMSTSTPTQDDQTGEREESHNSYSIQTSIQTLYQEQEQTLRLGSSQGQESGQASIPPVVAASTETIVQQAGENTLLDIMQSLPPMSSPPQPPVLSGRATRSLGSVLLEGHLVQQDRLEVAQNIQRMLRGVDMNYQLGEILLMFKLLTPDQLLAASLVSYGLLTTTQIRALGRIRQELHSIGLEYDLENLLILFRILSPEQLREVRASWSA